MNQGPGEAGGRREGETDMAARGRMRSSERYDILV
jgi:hypothetical protein